MRYIIAEIYKQSKAQEKRFELGVLTHSGVEYVGRLAKDTEQFLALEVNAGGAVDLIYVPNYSVNAVRVLWL